MSHKRGSQKPQSRLSMTYRAIEKADWLHGGDLDSVPQTETFSGTFCSAGVAGEMGES